MTRCLQLLFIIASFYIYNAEGLICADLSQKPSSIAEKPYSELELFFFNGQQFETTKLFTTAEIVVKFDEPDRSVDYRIYQSHNHSLIEEQYAADHQWLGLFRRFQLWNQIKLHPFTDTYVGVATAQRYCISFRITAVDFTLLFLFISGIALIFSAKSLSRNVAFHYGSGISFGVLASFLIILFIVYRSIPKKSLGVSFLIGGSSIFLWAFYSLWQNLYTFLMNYQSIISLYLVTTAFVSFAIVYRVGPPTDPRTLNLLQWTLQAAGCVLVNCGCQSREIAAFVVILCVILYNFPASLMNWAYRQWRYYHPIPRRLLTEREYRDQGVIETEKSLRALRTYCQSPEASPWKIMSVVKDKQRFADFVENSAHLKDDELQLHDATYDGLVFDDDITDDDSDQEFASTSGRGSRAGSRARGKLRRPIGANGESLLEDLLFTDDEGDLNVIDEIESTQSADVTADFLPRRSDFYRQVANVSRDSSVEERSAIPSTSATSRYHSPGQNTSKKAKSFATLSDDDGDINANVTDDEEDFLPPEFQTRVHRRHRFESKLSSEGIESPSPTSLSNCFGSHGKAFTKTRVRDGQSGSQSFMDSDAARFNSSSQSKSSSPYINGLSSVGPLSPGHIATNRIAQATAGYPNGEIASTSFHSNRYGIRRNIQMEEQDSD